MALKQVGARTEGDVYQGLFFWQQAADLLRPTSLVDRVVLEHDEADGVDDVAVFFRAPGTDAGRLVCVSSKFEGRHLAHGSSSWETSAAQVHAFLGDHERRARLHAAEPVIAIECHGSFALLAGWELSRNTGGVIAAHLQKPSLVVWRPTENAAAGPSWAAPQTIEKNQDAEDVAICLSVTHDARAEVEVSDDGKRNVRLESLGAGGFARSGHVNGSTPAVRTALLHETVEPMLERELQHREIVPEGGSYAAKLIGWVEVSGADA